MESIDRIYYAIKAKDLPTLRAIRDNTRKEMHKLSIRLGITIDQVEALSPEEAERQNTRMFLDDAKDYNRYYVDEDDNGWYIKNNEDADWSIAFHKPRSLYDYLDDRFDGYEYERIVICRLTGLTPEEVDDMSVGLFARCQGIIHTQCPSLTAKGRLR